MIWILIVVGLVFVGWIWHELKHAPTEDEMFKRWHDECEKDRDLPKD